MSNVRVTVVRTARDKLSRQVWEFWLNGSVQLVLDIYRVEQRPTRRHGWRATGVHNRLQPRASTIMERDTPLPTDVVAEALQQVRERLSVHRWSELRR